MNDLAGARSANWSTCGNICTSSTHSHLDGCALRSQMENAVDVSHGTLHAEERLIDAKDVASWLKVSEDWVWDHSTRRAPFLPAIWISTGTVKFRRSAIQDFLTERERLSFLKRKRGKHSSVSSPLVTEQDWNEPLIDAKDIASWLDVSEDWTWDHSKRRAPFLPGIWLSNGVLRFRRSGIQAFLVERERLSSWHRNRRNR